MAVSGRQGQTERRVLPWGRRLLSVGLLLVGGARAQRRRLPACGPAEWMHDGNCIPHGCASWFDGCNTCLVLSGQRIGSCTKMPCTKPGEQFCQTHDDGRSCDNPATCEDGSPNKFIPRGSPSGATAVAAEGSCTTYSSVQADGRWGVDEQGTCRIGWCRPATVDADGRKECVPYVREGQACSDGSQANFEQRCDPDSHLVCAGLSATSHTGICAKSDSFDVYVGEDGHKYDTGAKCDSGCGWTHPNADGVDCWMTAEGCGAPPPPPPRGIHTDGWQEANGNCCFEVADPTSGLVDPSCCTFDGSIGAHYTETPQMQACRVMHNMRYDGVQLTGSPVEISAEHRDENHPLWAQCCTLCDSTKNCRAWSFVNTGDQTSYLNPTGDCKMFALPPENLRFRQAFTVMSGSPAAEVKPPSDGPTAGSQCKLARVIDEDGLDDGPMRDISVLAALADRTCGLTLDEYNCKDGCVWDATQQPACHSEASEDPSLATSASGEPIADFVQKAEAACAAMGAADVDVVSTGMDCFECVASGRFYGENGRCEDDWQDFPIVTQDQAGFLVCSNNHNKGERCCESLTGESYDVHRCVELNEIVGHTYGDDPYSSLTCDHQCIKCPIWVCQTNCMDDDCIEQCRRPQPPPDCHTTFDGTDPKTCQCVAHYTAACSTTHRDPERVAGARGALA